jgi:hypothetical protein
MTLNPESVHYEEIREIEEHHERNTARSVKGVKEPSAEMQDEFDFTKFL